MKVLLDEGVSVRVKTHSSLMLPLHEFLSKDGIQSRLVYVCQHLWQFIGKCSCSVCIFACDLHLRYSVSVFTRTGPFHDVHDCRTCV